MSSHIETLQRIYILNQLKRKSSFNDTSYDTLLQI